VLAQDAVARLRLEALPKNARETLRPIMVVQRRLGKTILVQSPLAPSFLVLVFAQNPTEADKGKLINDTVKPVEYQVISLLVGDQ
jgi:hypothetical protein